MERLKNAKRYLELLRDSRTPQRSTISNRLVKICQPPRRFLQSLSFRTEGEITYPYQPLDLSVGEIRLLKMEYTERGVRYSIVHSPLGILDGTALCFSFTALSYCWGDTSVMTSVVEIDGQPVRIGRNLQDFFTEMERSFGHLSSHKERQPGDMIHLWIDALCINQNDNTEKLSQIKIMDQIYARAESVIVWLGTGKQAEEALESLQIVAVALLMEEARGDETAKRVMITRRDLRQRPEQFEKLAEIFMRPYFHRAWPTQELVFANPKRTFVYLGRQRCLWRVFTQFDPCRTDLDAYRKLLYGSKSNATMEDKRAFMLGHSFARCKMIETVQRRLRAGKSSSLLGLLLATMSLRATQSKDRIFSFWSLASDAQELFPNPDLELSDGQVFFDFAKAWIERYERLDVLSLRAIPLQRFKNEGPRWVVDWADEGRICRPFISVFPTALDDDFLDEIETSRIYDAAKGTGVVVGFLAESGLAAALYTAGVSCDTVTIVGEKGLPPTFSLQSWYDLLCGHFPAGNKQQQQQQQQHRDFNAAMIAGRDPYGERFDITWHISAFYQVPPDTGIMDKDELERDQIIWRQHIASLIIGRRLAITAGGHVGLVPIHTEPGDEIAIIFGCSVPLVLRHLAHTGENPRVIVGDCYFHRMMDGQMMEAPGVVKPGPDLVPQLEILENTARIRQPGDGVYTQPYILA